MISSRQQGARLNAFDTTADLRAAEQEGWKARRISRREAEQEVGCRNIVAVNLDSDGAGYVVEPE